MSTRILFRIAGFACKFALIALALSVFTSAAFGAVELDDKVRLTDSSNCDHPSWSPDGQSIAYSSEQAIWSVNADGSGARKLYDALAWDGDPEYNHDGNKLYYSSESKTAFSARYLSIHVMDAAGGNIIKITDSADSREPSLSSDGSKIAYTSKLSGNYDIWIMNLDGSNKRQITDSEGDETSPSWSSDGSKIAYSHKGDIYTIGIDSIVPVRLTNDTYDNIDPSYSPDGKLISFASNRAGNYDIWMMSPDENSFFRATYDESIQKSPTWRPDGSSFAYVSNEGGEFNIWITNVDLKEVEFEILEEYKEDPVEIERNSHLERIRVFAVENPEKFILSVLLICFVSVVSIIYAFLSRIK